MALWSTWRDVRVRGLSPAKLRSLVVKAKNAAQKEAFTESLWEAKMRPLQDARLRAEDAAYRALLDLHAQVMVLGRNDPVGLEAFAFLADHVSGTRESERAHNGGGVLWRRGAQRIPSIRRTELLSAAPASPPSSSTTAGPEQYSDPPPWVTEQ